MTDCGCVSHSGFLTKAGYALVAQREGALYETVDMFARLREVDSRVSVSGMRRDEIRWPCDHVLDEQHRRFLNGS